MVFWTVMITMSFVSLAATAITIICLIDRNNGLRNRSERRLQNNDDNDNQNQNQVIRNDNRKKNCPSRPGDKCRICLQVMTRETMSFMNCGHAVHNGDCFEAYRRTRRDCSYCGKYVLRLDLPGDNCAICNQPMEEYDMKYVKCEHAFHLHCLITNNISITDKCPRCSIQIIPRNA
ncbi:uncharacterized protein LOC117575014 [Drosophila albomicans]|uniref:Uncharacterized protein LOC117575014 n=1 Tax=Drosophila albomicans TaxID=7291 RepID=A0A6P8ZDK3_DROAB|nr:uncharacterized protein LOC117575014 [Drosophila albomicans]